MAFQSISSFCASNLPGLLTIEYAPVAWIDTDAYLRRVANQVWQSGVPFSEGTWLQLPILDRKDHIWTQSQRTSSQGPSYQQQVSGLTPKLRVAVENEFAKMALVPFLLRLRDRNGNYWKLGTVESPFYFTTNGTSGGGGQRNQYEVTFQAETSERAFGLP